MEHQSHASSGHNLKPEQIVIVGGCGHVGLPLGVTFSLTGNFQVTLVDTSRERVEMVNSGRFPFVEENGDEFLAKVVGKTLVATESFEAIRSADYVIVVTGTPVDEHLSPRVGDVLQTIKQILPLMKAGQLLVLRSTLFPGTSELVYKQLTQLKKDIGLAFCPERVAQGYALTEIKTLPQIVSSFDKTTEQKAATLFSRIASDILILTPAEAELAKLFCNTWRYIQFAIANQFYMISQSEGLDFYRIHAAISYRYPRSIFPSAGLTAGPCLFKDTLQLSAFHNNHFFLGHAAMLINEGLPDFMVKELEKQMGSLEGKKIGLLGMSFKANNDDTRNSLSYKIKKILENKFARVLDTDVFQPTASRLENIVETADAFILGAPHDAYRNLDLKGRPFVDCWGIWHVPKVEMMEKAVPRPNLFSEEVAVDLDLEKEPPVDDILLT